MPLGGTAPPSRRARGGGFYGFKLHLAVCTATGLPMAWQIETARRQESNFVAPLLDTIRAWGFHSTTVAMDKGYDNSRVYAECEECGCEPIIPLRGARKQTMMPLALGGRLFPRIPGTRSYGVTSTVAAPPSNANPDG
jgi:hypothetical protein